MEPNQIYIEITIENSRFKRNKRELEDPATVIKSVSPTCGGEVSLQIHEKDGTIEDASFTGIGCTVSQAPAYITIGLIKGKTEEEAMHLAETSLSMIKRDRLDEETQDELEDAAAFRNVSKLPACVKRAAPV